MRQRYHDRVDWDKTGRVAQKRRTHVALVGAAGELIREGVTPTIAAAAERTGISRATAYRYFASNDALAVEATLELALAERPSFGTSSGRPDEDVDHLVADAFSLIAANEPQFRQMLRALLDPAAAPSRAGRRLAWIENALAGLDDVRGRDRDRLIAGLALITGSESYVVLRDVCGLDNDTALDVTRWVARALLASASAGDHKRSRAARTTRSDKTAARQPGTLSSTT
jgi:AcrR family transcriptional regulator